MYHIPHLRRKNPSTLSPRKEEQIETKNQNEFQFLYTSLSSFIVLATITVKSTIGPHLLYTIMSHRIFFSFRTFIPTFCFDRVCACLFLCVHHNKKLANHKKGRLQRDDAIEYYVYIRKISHSVGGNSNMNRHMCGGDKKRLKIWDVSTEGNGRK